MTDAGLKQAVSLHFLWKELLLSFTEDRDFQATNFSILPFPKSFQLVISSLHGILILWFN